HPRRQRRTDRRCSIARRSPPTRFSALCSPGKSGDAIPDRQYSNASEPGLRSVRSPRGRGRNSGSCRDTADASTPGSGPNQAERVEKRGEAVALGIGRNRCKLLGSVAARAAVWPVAVILSNTLVLFDGNRSLLAEHSAA